MNNATKENQMNAITSQFVGVQDAIIKNETTHAKTAVHKEQKVKAIVLDMTKKNIAVYNPYNHESLLAAAILSNKYLSEYTITPKNGYAQECNFRAVSFEDIIPENADCYIWIGVKALPSTGSTMVDRSARHIQYGFEQPAKSVPSKPSFIKSILGKGGLTERQVRDNKLIEFVDGPEIDGAGNDHRSHITLLDKVMFDFGITDNLDYRRLSINCKFWENGELDEAEEAAFHGSLTNAVHALEQGLIFKRSQVKVSAVKQYHECIADQFRMLSKKAAFYRIDTVNGIDKVAILTVPASIAFIAARHFSNIGSKYLIMTQGMNGRFFTGNVRLKKGALLNEKIEYID